MSPPRTAPGLPGAVLFGSRGHVDCGDGRVVAGFGREPGAANRPRGQWPCSPGGIIAARLTSHPGHGVQGAGPFRDFFTAKAPTYGSEPSGIPVRLVDMHDIVAEPAQPDNCARVH